MAEIPEPRPQNRDRVVPRLTRVRPEPYWRTLLILGRVSNLPTVWSNCLAGWLLGGGGSLWGLALVSLGGSCLYLGGMFLNDAFDVDFDRHYRKERPVPAGLIDLDAVWRWGFGWLGLGTVLLVLLGRTTGALTALLLLCIILYDAVHKHVGLSPLLMAACRFFLYLVAASTGALGVTGLGIWSALALAAYIVGLSYLARQESTGGTLNSWPCYLLVVPMVLACLANAEDFRQPALLLAAVLGLWIVRCLRHAFLLNEPNVGRAVGGLLAGIVLVDWLAIAGSGSARAGAAFAGLFLVSLLFQRSVPAT